MDNLAAFPQLVPVFKDIETIIGKDTYDMWLRPAQFVFEGNTLTISLPNQFWGKTIHERYQHIITDDHKGRPYKLNILFRFPRLS